MLYNCGMILFILSFFVGYILSFSLVRLRTIRLSARGGSHIECTCSRSCAEDVTITEVIIKILDRKRDWIVDDVISWSEGLGILMIFEKKQWVEIWRWTRLVDFWAWARPVQLGLRDAPRVCWVRWNSQHSKNCVSLSSCRKTKLKKVIMLYFDLRPGQTCPSKVMHRKEVTHSNGSYERKSRRRAWLTKWDKVKNPMIHS